MFCRCGPADTGVTVAGETGRRSEVRSIVHQRQFRGVLIDWIVSERALMAT